MLVVGFKSNEKYLQQGDLHSMCVFFSNKHINTNETYFLQSPHNLICQQNSGTRLDIPDFVATERVGHTFIFSVVSTDFAPTIPLQRTWIENESCGYCLCSLRISGIYFIEISINHEIGAFFCMHWTWLQRYFMKPYPPVNPPVDTISKFFQKRYHWIHVSHDHFLKGIENRHAVYE